MQAIGSFTAINPALEADGKNPMSLDSKEPKADFREFIMNEVRYNSLTRSFPERAEVLFDAAEKSAKEKLDKS